MQTTQQLVKIAALYEGQFVQAAGESVVDFEYRILAMEAAQEPDAEESKVFRYVDAMERGATLPPCVRR
jgi:hypothetical protein